ncbi:helix-turn-helix domain-containing protein [Frankia sp. AgB1.9]|uniref:IclR family transcriptional regulator n=1 Tax=unclassified Frankia TaxID=2632575 RepID=UPI001932B264|nr:MULTISPECIES: helix-turn-helix domain-containing protein [unclassified Frankia]MBL7489414.1 helix-turn-helix domain-containing protein [Frankia sp. AgW1.1]MBL7550651.1 helix-turn-helix domain-containing protein [Frankia sp. AgB1.9]MBL7620974.1 helix-turn-helix domain-containing protein [Frankia sp. AgB1.8]
MPTQPARSVQRAAQVLKVLAAAPETDRSLSEIAQAVGIPRSSAQAILLALCDEGLAVRRDPGPRYRLGPQLLGLGRAASHAVMLTDILATQLPLLRDEFQATTMGGTVHGDSVVIAAACPVPHPYGLTVKAGGTLPLRAPVGPIYVAWAGEEAAARWLDHAAPPLTSTERESMRVALVDVRTRGWSATVSALGAEAISGAHEVTDADLTSACLRVIGISAPVWAADGTFACSIALTALPSDISGRELRRVASRVVDVATHVMGLIGGTFGGLSTPVAPG